MTNFPTVAVALAAHQAAKAAHVAAKTALTTAELSYPLVGDRVQLQVNVRKARLVEESVWAELYAARMADAVDDKAGKLAA